MSSLSKALFVAWVSLMACSAGAAGSAAPATDPGQLLKQADSYRTSNQAEFAAVLKRLGDGSLKLTAHQRMYLLYLEAFEFAYKGNYAKAVQQLDQVIDQAADPELRFRAGLSVVNVLGIGAHYEKAYSQLNQLLDELPSISDKEARLQALATAAQLFSQAGQYDLALQYSDQLLKENPSGSGACKAMAVRTLALYKDSQLAAFARQAPESLKACVKAKEPIYSSLMLAYMASSNIEKGSPKKALKLLLQGFNRAKDTRYPPLVSVFDSLLAKAYWALGDEQHANQFALDAVGGRLSDQYPESLVDAYRLLYQISKKQGDMALALAYHERYMEADKGYLNSISAKALAYQTVKQQVLAKKLQIDTLAKQNRILQLQQALSKKAVEASRLWIVLLLLLLGSIGFITYRIKRSQLRFMKLARRDGLTGIFNRQHFVSEAERQLQYCRKSSRDACLVLIDLDHFKAVNDTHGHAVGDRVLKRAVAACQAHLRSTDVFGRLGGEEFGIVLPECALDQVLARVEQMRMAIATVSAGGDVPDIPISASFGVASVTNSGYELRQLMIDADDALYRAKREGRNRVSLFDSQHAHLSVV